MHPLPWRRRAGAIASLGWPATEKIQCGRRWFQFDLTGSPTGFVITDFTKYEAFSFKWRSPLYIFAATGSGPRPCAILAEMVGELGPLLHAAAQAAFWTFSQTALRALGRALSLGDLASDALPGSLTKLLRVMFSNMADNDTVQVLQQHIKFREDLPDFLKRDEVREMLTKDDADGVSKVGARPGQGHRRVEDH